MEHFCEQLIARKNTAKIIRVKIAVWVIMLILGILIALGGVLLGLRTGLSMLFPIAVVAFALSIYMAIKFSKALNIEYEYIFTNGCFDIDRISARTNRVRLISADCKDVEEFGPYNPREHENKTYAKTVSAVSAPDATGQYFAVIRQPDTGRVLVIFEPDDRSLEHITKFIPRNVLAEYKRNAGI